MGIAVSIRAMAIDAPMLGLIDIIIAGVTIKALAAVAVAVAVADAAENTCVPNVGYAIEL